MLPPGRWAAARSGEPAGRLTGAGSRPSPSARASDAARSLGRSMRILKAETRGLQDDDVNAKAEAQNGRQPLDRGQSQSQSENDKFVDPIDRVRDK